MNGKNKKRPFKKTQTLSKVNGKNIKRTIPINKKNALKIPQGMFPPYAIFWHTEPRFQLRGKLILFNARHTL